MRDTLSAVRSDPGIIDRVMSLEDELEAQAASEAEAAFETFIEFAPAFLAVEDPPARYIIPEITPVGVLKLAHGDPRTLKSLATLEELIAAATATPAYGMERFQPERKHMCLYCSQEDASQRVRPRAKGFLKARGIERPPETLAFAVYKGIDLDSPEWQERFFEQIVRYGVEHVAIDPTRSFTANADKGPAEVMPLAKFLRRLTVRGITVQLVHHDVKPLANGPDNRRRSHKASGGAWFSVSECPVSFEKIGESRSIVSPEDFKFSSDPQPFTIEYRETGDGAIRLIGETATAEEAQALAVDERILIYLGEHSGASGNSISKGLHVRRENVTEALNRLTESGKVDEVKHGKKVMLFLKGQGRLLQ